MFKNKCPLFHTTTGILGYGNMTKNMFHLCVAQLLRNRHRVVVQGDLNTEYKRVSVYTSSLNVSEAANGLVWLMVFHATFNNISVISCRSVLLVE